MKVEIRADSITVSGYVNVPGRESRPVVTPRGTVTEVIEQRAFERAIKRAGHIDVKLDHEKTIASTIDGTAKVFEDAVGLRAEAIITDSVTVESAKTGKLKGWSFNMMNVKDEIEERTGSLPLRKVKDFDMTEITLVLNKNPVYSSTSIEVRSDEEYTVEYRTEQAQVNLETVKEKVDYSAYEARINSLKPCE